MPETEQYHETNCNYCEESTDCEKHVCDFCDTCEGVIFYFGDELDFDLCPECLTKLQFQLQKGLIRLDQGLKQPTYQDDNEKLKVIRKNITESERQEVFDRDNWQCVICGSIEYLQVDHKFPFARGGTTQIDNLQTLCKDCNSKKRDKLH